MKILPVGAELFRAGERTDMTKLMVTFRSLANAPKNLQMTCASLTKHATNDVEVRLRYFLVNFDVRWRRVASRTP
jgi:hypothetical protein